MKVLFISSGNLSKGRPSVLIKNQGISLMKEGIIVEYHTIKGKGILGYLNSIPSILKKIKSTSPNVIHSHYSLSAFATTLALLIYRLKFPHIVSLMGSDSKMLGWKKTLTKVFSKYNWDITIVKSESIARDLGIDEYHVLPNGVDLSTLKLKNIIPNNIILFPANPSRESKNFKLAKEAFNIAKKQLSDLELEVCYGVTHDKMITKLQYSGIVLITSLWEGSPNIVKEAMALNKVIICTKVGDTEWLLKDIKGCYLVNFDAQQIANKIILGIKLNQHTKMINGRKQIQALNLDSISIAKKLIGYYIKVC